MSLLSEYQAGSRWAAKTELRPRTSGTPEFSASQSSGKGTSTGPLSGVWISVIQEGCYVMPCLM